MNESIFNLDDEAHIEEGNGSKSQMLFARILNMLCENGEMIVSKEHANQFCEKLGFNFHQLLKIENGKER